MHPNQCRDHAKKRTLPRKGDVPEEDGDWRECNDVVGEAIAGPSTMNLDQSPPRHIPTTSMTAMMIQQVKMELECKGVSLKPYKNFISRKYKMS